MKTHCWFSDSNDALCLTSLVLVTVKVSSNCCSGERINPPGCWVKSSFIENTKPNPAHTERCWSRGASVWWCSKRRSCNYCAHRETNTELSSLVGNRKWEDRLCRLNKGSRDRDGEEYSDCFQVNERKTRTEQHNWKKVEGEMGALHPEGTNGGGGGAKNY